MNILFLCFRLYNGKAAENELKQISSDQHTFGQDLVKHNLVVFKNGEGALKVSSTYIYIPVSSTYSMISGLA